MQNGIPLSEVPGPGQPLHGIYYGVVLSVYAADDVEAQRASSPPQILCDVAFMRGGRCRAVVLQRGSSIRNRSLWVPAASTLSLSTDQPLNLKKDESAQQVTDPNDLDGERVIVSFLGGDRDHPVILGSIEHPRASRTVVYPGELQPVERGAGDGGPKRKLESTDRAVCHQGTIAKIDRGGSARVDLRRAGVSNSGLTFDADGETSGVVDVSMRTGGELVIRNEAGVPVFHLRITSGGVELDIGQAASERVILGDAFASLFDSHTHLTPYGKTGPVSPEQTVATAELDAGTRVLSPRVKLPAGNGG